MTDTKSLKTTFLYVGASLAILLIILLIIQMCRKNQKINREFNKRYNVIVKTPKGLVRADNESVANELEIVKDHLYKNAAGAQENCEDLTPQINRAMKNLAIFIKDNPADNTEALCSLELKADIVNQYMQDSIVPDQRDWATSYKTLLDWEEYERDLPKHPMERLKYLINNLDIIIKLLRFDLCNNGHIDLEELHKILLTMNVQICKTGSMYAPDGQQIVYGEDPYSRYNRPPPLPLFIKDQYSLEPFDSHAVRPRALPKRGSFAKINNSLHRPPSLFLSTDRLVPTNDFSGIGETITIGDNSFEGDVERDILGYKPPGQIISQLHDSSDHYTVNVNACGGKTVPDDELIKQCVSRETPLFNALAGDATQMLGCIGDCDKEPNYFNWYNKMDVAERDTNYIYGGEDLYDG